MLTISVEFLEFSCQSNIEKVFGTSDDCFYIQAMSGISKYGLDLTPVSLLKLPPRKHTKMAPWEDFSRQSCSALKKGLLDFNPIHIFRFLASTD